MIYSFEACTINTNNKYSVGDSLSGAGTMTGAVGRSPPEFSFHLIHLLGFRPHLRAAAIIVGSISGLRAL